MNKLSIDKQRDVISALVERNSIRATVRATGVAKNTIVKLLVDLGRACARYHDHAIQSLPCKRIQCDETWSFRYAKTNNVPAHEQGRFGFGDVWTWTAICGDTKLIASWFVGGRDSQSAREFVHDLTFRLKHRVRLTTDGHRVYLDAVESAFGSEIDCAVLAKIYGTDAADDTKYSPAEFVDSQPIAITGHPGPKHISASFIERQNLTIRKSMRRSTRLTNAFSKKVENHAHAVALHLMYYNFCRVHQSLRVTPAMEAKITDHVWSIYELIGLMPDLESQPRGPYKKSKRSN